MSSSPRPVAGGKDSTSGPDHPEQHSFLTLPPEVRNHVYYFLLEQDRNVFVQTSTHLQNCSVKRHNVCSVTMQIGLLLSCRQIFHEASSSFYSNNGFMIDHVRNERLSECSYPGSFLTFLDTIGSQARLLRKVVVDVPSESKYALQTDGFFTYQDEHEDFNNQPQLMDLTSFVKGAWRKTFEFDLTLAFVGSTGPFDEWGPISTLSAVNITLSLLMKDQLRIRKFARTIAAIRVHHDGSGGVVVWKEEESFRLPYENQCCHYDIHGFNDKREHYLQFQTNAAEEQLQSVVHHPRVSWQGLKLPEVPSLMVFYDALYINQLVELDLDNDTCFPFGAAIVSRAFYERWWDMCVNDSSFRLRMSTDELRSSFSGFEALKRLLRKERFEKYHTPLYHPMPLFHSGLDVSIVLDFKLKTSATLADIRLSILPLVLESSQLSHKGPITIRLWTTTDGIDVLTAEHTITQQELRFKVAIALEAFAYSHADGYSAEVWIDGLGEVAECCMQPCLTTTSSDAIASELERAGNSTFRVVRFHSVDYKYRDMACFTSLERDRDCVFSDLSQLFPFPGSIFKTYRYVRYAANNLWPPHWLDDDTKWLT